MQRILVINAKGGCGKSTIATNLAGYFADQGEVTALLDYDPQGSSMRWLSLRGADRADIQGIAAYQRRQGITHSFQMHLPTKPDRTIIDTPSGVSGLQLVDYINQVDTILLPVLPSPIDIHATARFIQELLLVGKVRSRNIRLGIIANRIRRNTLVFNDLSRFLDTLRIPLIATIRDSQNHMRAAEQGLSVLELKGKRLARDHGCWAPLIAWLDENGMENVNSRKIA